MSRWMTFCRCRSSSAAAILAADEPRLFVGHRQLLEPAVQRLARHPLDHDIGRHEIAGPKQPARAGRRAAARSSAPSRSRRWRRILAFGAAGFSSATAPDAGWAAIMSPYRRVNAFPDRKTASARRMRSKVSPSLTSRHQAVGQPLRQAVVADAVGRGVDIIGHAQ